MALLPSLVLAAESNEVGFSSCIEGVQINLGSQLSISPREIPFIENYLDKPFGERYGLFSKRYKEGLERAFNIKNANDYAEYEQQRNYERGIINSEIVSFSKGSEAVVSVTILACWSETGYSGLETYILELVKTDNKWEINHIAH